ncbi:MAG: SocA family protein [Thermoplasmata archaeon]|nr:SocA family protein [Thermoplasmata archaeon]
MCYNVTRLIKAILGRKEAMHKSLDAEKALEVVIYVSTKADNLFNIVKTIYYADKYHLARYGRLITGDNYIAMGDGPVPSGTYDLIKLVRGDSFSYESKIVNAHPEEALKVKVVKIEGISPKTFVYPRRTPNLDLLSESDIECLDLSIEKYGNMHTTRLWRLVHQEKSYQKTQLDNPIPLREIITLDISNGKDAIEYLES